MRMKSCVYILYIMYFMIPALYGQHNRNRAVLAENRIPFGPLPDEHHVHAATITKAVDGTLIAAWFGGSHENHPDVKIWVSRREKNADWTEPVMVDNGNRLVDGKEREFSCWNPVLYTDPEDGRIFLWFKITGTKEAYAGFRNWWGAVRISGDNGKTWGERIWLPEVPADASPVFDPYSRRACGPVKNRPLVLPDKRLLCGASTETEAGWLTHFEVYQAGDWTGEKQGVNIIGPIGGNGIQPSFIVLSPDCRTLGAFIRDNGITWSEDGGETWSAIGQSPVTTSKGFHALTTRNGVHFLAFNPDESRTPLSLARSFDGRNWEVILPKLKEDGAKSMDYPTMIQSSGGRIHIVHTYGREYINHIVLDSGYLERNDSAPR